MYQRGISKFSFHCRPDFTARRILPVMVTTPTSLPDSELATGVAAGDRTAESSLYEKYSQRVFYLALSERCAREDAEDIRAETFLRVIQSLREGKLRKPGSLASFIVGIALNVIREHKRQRTAAEPLSESQDEIPDTYSPETAIVNREEARLILATAAQLKDRDRAFLRMYYYEELPKPEIARALGIKEDRLRLIKSRALKRFQEIYAKLKGTDT
jgi:RNA polymerase sigma-70 factor (ECF subfamily)